MMDIVQLLNAKGVLPSKSVIENLTLLSKQYGIETYLLTTSEKKYILKLNKNPTNQLTVLKKIYEDLRDIKFISLKIYYSDNDLLLMEYFENDKNYILAIDDYEIIAKFLSELHSKKGTSYGYGYSTYLGNLIQNNEKSSSWTKFFLENRYDYYLEILLNRSLIDKRRYNKYKNFREVIKENLTEPSHPSLLHGDIWRGNILINRQAKTHTYQIIDPAIFYGDYEYELAYIYQNGTFGRGFYEYYNEINKISDEFWEFKILIYQIIPLMQYAILENKFYLREIDKIIDYFGRA
ncbi:MAG: fructosamine kinase family protein [Rhizobiales bacterium]|nr:fructosamine kinase family protein [Hyphomicrobiales bacterium]